MKTSRELLGTLHIGEAWRTFRVLAITGFLIWLGLHELDANRRGEHSLLLWYIVIASIALAALIDLVWERAIKRH